MHDKAVRHGKNVTMATDMNNFVFNILKLISCNCHGYNARKLPYISNKLTSCDILFLQEHWLSETQLNTLNGVSSITHLSVGVRGFPF